ncbi:MAG: EamA family transporter [bacterium]|nr:EamA family transporter [bacterium]
MAFLLGVLVAVSIGSADFLSGIAARRIPTSVVVTYSQLWGLVPLGIYVAAVDRTVPPAWDHLLGVFAGLGLVVGICCLVRGLSVGRMSVVAPTTASLGAAVGVVYGFAVGERPGTVAVVGVVLAVSAVVLIAHTAEHHETDSQAPPARARAAVASRAGEMLLATGAGLALGSTQIFFASSGDDAGMWPVASARLTAGVLAGAFVLWRVRAGGRPARLTAGDVRLVAAYALLDTLGTCLLVEAFRLGLVSLVAPVAALFPAMTVLWARLILHDRMNRGQVAGFGVAAAGLVLIGLG